MDNFRFSDNQSPTWISSTPPPPEGMFRHVLGRKVIRKNLDDKFVVSELMFRLGKSVGKFLEKKMDIIMFCGGDEADLWEGLVGGGWAS